MILFSVKCIYIFCKKGKKDKMIIWRRWGILVVVAFIAGVVASGLYMDSVRASDITQLNNSQTVVWGLLFIFASAGLNWISCRLLLKNEGEKIVTDDDGKKFKFTNYSSFFYIRNFYWTYILAGFGLIITLISIFNK